MRSCLPSLGVIQINRCNTRHFAFCFPKKPQKFSNFVICTKSKLFVSADQVRQRAYHYFNPFSSLHDKKYLFHNFLFAISFSTGVFLLAAVVDDNRQSKQRSYSRFKHYAHQFKKGPTEGQVMRGWKQIPEYQQTLFCLIALNTAIFLLSLSKSPAATSLLNGHFVSRFHAPHYAAVTSAFAHSSFMHFALNMAALYSFGTFLHQLCGREQFLAFYLSALAFSSHASLVAKYFQRSRYTGSLGASGGLFAIMGTLLRFKALKVSIIFLPFVHIPLSYAICGFAAFDLYGLLTGLHYFDHAAHLGGLAFGYLYLVKGKELIWDKRRLYLDRLGLSKR